MCDQAQPIDTVESLMNNPERLKELRQQCKLDRAELGDELCNRVGEASLGLPPSIRRST
ncbi:hypothetical protein H2Y57_06965 [Pectobacterium aroidearum]|uniref:Transcriptional regulator n=1 Tax=Pectobacterium aroidearum TaxID=1201031 RepID=A0AAW3SS88_9GAMM|nr:hypothetical protein [Pectobacterium aroidearum]MBA5203429.1 hypothetical protein [Pectobacterium aroidearum]